MKTKTTLFPCIGVASMGSRILPALLAVLSLLPAGRATAQITITVTSTADSGAGTLRAALAGAASGDTIDATGVSGSILLTSGELLVTNNVTLLGPGPTNLAVNGNAASRVFNISGTVVTIAGLTITNGRSLGSGGGIFTGPGTVTVSNCAFSGNSARYGGGIFGNHSILTVSTCTLSGNTASSNGGGIFINHGTLTVSNCTLIGNLASNDSGGGIYNYARASGDGTMQIVSSTLIANLAGYGAGIYNDGQLGGKATLTVSASTFSSNSASRWGGGIYNDGSSGTGIVQVTDSTLSGNSAQYGGGIENDGYKGSATLTVSASALSGNSATNGGGGIYNNGESSGNAALTVSNSTLTNNSAQYGGSIYNDGQNGSAPLTVSGSTLSGNSASANGGGIYNNGGSSGNAMLTVSNSTLSGNSAGVGSGGGIFNDGTSSGTGTVQVAASTLSGNYATYDAGGIYNNGQSGKATLNVSASTLSGNGASYDAGGIYNDGRSSGNATLTMSGSTVSGNWAGYDCGGIYNDGRNGSATLTMSASTFSGNSAGYAVGGIYNDGRNGSATLTVSASTLSGNSANYVVGGIYSDGTDGSANVEIGSTILKSYGNIVAASGTVSSDGYNLASDGGGGFLTGAADQINTDPMLGPLQDNGGPTFTHALSPGSPAIDMGKNFNGSATDQRGLPRTVERFCVANAPVGDGTDIGAFELQQPCPVTLPLVFTVVHGFTAPVGNNGDGASPSAGLILSDGTLYGTAYSGGSSGAGTVFAVNTDGTGFTNLHSFNPSDGVSPSSGLILSSNTLYGTAFNGGSSGNGTVFAISTDGTGLTNLHSFTQEVIPCSNGSCPSNYWCVGGICVPINGSPCLNGSCPSGYQCNGGICVPIVVRPICPVCDPCAHCVCSTLECHCVTDQGGGCGGALPEPKAARQATAGTFIPINFDGAHPIGGLVLSNNTLYGTATAGGSSGAGTVFAVNTDGTGLTVLHNFSGGSDGASPWAGLILSGSTLYGTTYSGGTSGYGTVFAVNTDGTGFTNLYSFTGATDGANPRAGLILSSNTLYGTAFAGGSWGHGTVFAVNTDGTGFTNLYSFTGATDGANPSAGLILSGSTLCGTASSGGTSGYGTVFAVNTDGTGFAILHSFAGSDGANPSAGLILSSNTLYGTTTSGGSSGNGTVFSISFRPQLTITPAGTNFVLTWPGNIAGFDYTGYTLQSTANLGSPEAWTTNSPAPVVVNGQNTVTNPITGPQQFYRLVQ